MGKVFNALNKAGSLEKPRPENREPKLVKPTKVKKEIIKQGPYRHWDERLALAAASDSQISESVRVLRTKILYPFMGKPPQTLLVTSAVAGEGKSFVCAGLGISFAKEFPRSCTIIDCNAQQPSIHDLFGVDAEPGLVDVLEDEDSLEDVLVSSGLENLTLLPLGSVSQSNAELIGSEVMKDTLQSLIPDDRGIVLLDGPSFGGTSHATQLAQYVDGVILVIRTGTPWRKFMNRLSAAIGRDKIIAVVFNGYKEVLSPD